MNQFSERSFWTSPSVLWASDMLKKDHFIVSQKDPFVQGLLESASMNKEQLQNFKSEYWPSLLTSVHHENPYLRTLAIDLLVSEKQSDVEKEIWHHWEDPFPLCRILLIDRFQSQNRTKLFQELFIILTKDPLLWVRRKASQRISKDFPDLLSYQFENFEVPEQLHLLELLDSTITADRKIMETSFQSNDELSLWINYKIKEQGLLSDILLKEEYKSFRKKIDQSSYMISGDILDVSSIKDQAQLAAIIPSYHAVEDTAILEDFIYHGHDLEGSEEEVENTLNVLINLLKKRSKTIKSNWIDALFQNYHWNDSTINKLLVLVNKENYQLIDFLNQLVDEDDFFVNKEWIDGLNKKMGKDFINILLLKVRESPIGSASFRNSLLILLGGNQKQRLSVLALCLERMGRLEGKNETLIDLFDQANNLMPENFQAAIDQCWKDTPHSRMILLENLPETITPDINEDFFHELNFYHSSDRKSILENLVRINRAEFLPVVFSFIEDPSKEVKNFLQVLIQSDLSSDEKKSLEEWDAVG